MARGDFLISCSKTDKAWAQWVSGVLEEQGYSTYIYIRDNNTANKNTKSKNTENAAGKNKTKLKEYLKYSRCFIQILSDQSINSPYAEFERTEVTNTMKQDVDYHFLPIFVSQCDDASPVSNDECLCLFGIDEYVAEKMLLSNVNDNRAAVLRRHFYPGVNSMKQSHPAFPGAPLNISLATEPEFSSDARHVSKSAEKQELSPNQEKDDKLDTKMKIAGLAQAIVGVILPLGTLITTGNIIPAIIVFLCFAIIILIWKYRKKIINMSYKAGMLLLGYRTRLIIISSVVALIGLGIFIYKMNITVHYYGNINEIYGLPVGIGSELSKQSRDSRVGYWKITDNALSRTIRLSYITEYKNIDLAAESISAFSLSLFQPSAMISYKYEIGAGNVKEVLSATHYRSDGKKLMQILYNSLNDLEISYFDYNDTPQLFHSTVHRLINIANKSLPISLKQEYNSAGLVARRTFKALESISIGSVYGELYEYDENYSLSELHYIGSGFNNNVSVMTNETGIATVKFEYSDNDLVSVSYYADQDMKIVAIGYNGAHIEKIRYDGNHNIDSIYFIDENSNNVYDKNGVHYYQYEMNNSNNMIVKESFYGIDGNPVYHKTDGCTSKEYDAAAKNFNIIYNDRQRLSLENLTPAPLLPAMADDNGIADVNQVPDQMDDSIPSASETVNTIDSLTSRYVTISHVLDNSGTVKKVVYLGADGKSILNEYQYAERRYMIKTKTLSMNLTMTAMETRLLVTRAMLPSSISTTISAPKYGKAIRMRKAS